MLRFTRDVEQMPRKCGRKLRITDIRGVVSVRECSPHACVSAQEKKSGERPSIAQSKSSRTSS